MKPMGDEPNPLPNFIIVGAQKSGTTTLYATLAQHPEIGMSRIKEPNYFGSSGKRWAVDEAQYRELFADCRGKRRIGEATATYLYDEAALIRIQQELEVDTKIIIILRNPAKRAFSHWGHLRYYQLFETLPFEEALQQEDERPVVAAHRPGTFRYFWGGLYADKVRACFDLFGPERVHVVILEELIQQPETALAALFEFLEVDTAFRPVIERENAASESRAPFLTRWIVHRPPILDRLLLRLPPRWRRMAFEMGTRAFFGLQGQRREHRPQLDPQLYDRLMQQYEADIHQLETLLHRDLSIWYRVETTQPQP